MRMYALPMTDSPEEGRERDGLATARTQLRPVAESDLGRSSQAQKSDPSIGTLQTMASDPGMQQARLPDAIQFTRTVGGTGAGTDPPADAGLKNLVLSRLFPSRGPVKIGRYTILDRLGAGGMGIVYSAYDDRLDRKVAIKVLRPQTKKVDATGRTRLLREAQAMARLSHPNIVTVHESGEHEGEVFLAMEFVRGQSLDRWLRDHKRNWQQVVEVFLQAGRGLEAAHAAGLVHRDFKPGNVLIAEDGAVKVMDFGLARTSAEPSATDDTSASTTDLPTNRLLDMHLTSTGAVMGTPAYMAPEQHLGEPVTARTDQFNFCVALYEGLYGQLPFPTDNLAHLVDAVISGRISSPQPGHKVPPWIHRLVLQGLAVDPDRRHASMTSLLTALANDPAKRRRRLASAVALAGIVALATYAATAVVAAPEQPCANLDDEIADVWNPQRATAVEQALAATDQVYAADAWQRISPTLDGYRDQWLDTRTESCQQHQRGLLSSKLYDLQSNCLNQRRAHFDTLVQTLANADAGIAQRAIEAVAGLPSLARCDDTEALLAEVALPESDDLAQAVQASRLNLARAQSFEKLAKFDEGQQLVDEVLKSPQAASYPPLKSEGLLTRGSLQIEHGNPQEVAQTLEQASLIALEHGHDRVAAEALTKKLYTQGFRGGASARALEDMAMIDALVKRTGDRELRALLLNNQTAVLMRDGQYTQAQKTGSQALELKREVYGEDHPQYAFTLVNLGINSMHAGEFARAEAYQRQALELLLVQFGPNHPYTAMVQYNIGLALQRQERLDQARPYIEQALANYQRLMGPKALELRDMLDSLGDIAEDQRRFEDALKIFQRARDILEHHGGAPSSVASVVHAIARAHTGMGDHQQALALHQQAMAMRTANVKADDPGIVESWIELGNAAMERKDWAAAVQAFEAAVGLAGNPTKKALAHYRLGMALRGGGNLTEANVAANRSIDVFTKNKLKNPLVHAYLHYEAGKTALALGEPDRAVALLEVANNLFAATRSEQDPRRVLFDFERLKAAHASVQAGGLPTDTYKHLRTQVTSALAILEQNAPRYAREYNEISTWLKSH